jgi:uncharacterized protein YdhG (YjbR/CyaY superfamily)
MGFFDYFKPKWKISNAIGLRMFVVLFLSILSILVVLLVIFFTPLFHIEIDELGAKCKAGNKVACAKLADIAQNIKDSDSRERAVRILTDQTVLVHIAMNLKEEDWIRSVALKNPNLTNQGVLTKIAKNDESGWVRNYAADKLNDKFLAQSVYTYIVKNYEYEDLRSSATSKLTDQMLLTDIAKNDKQSLVRVNAADRLADKLLAQTIYFEVAKNAKTAWNRRAAVQRLTDQTQLINFAENDKEWDVRLAAVENPHFTDQNLLCFIAKNNKSGLVRSIAAKKITDQKLLAYIAKNDIDDWVRVVASDRLQELRRK